MNLPSQLMEMNAFQEGASFVGLCKAFTRPKLALATEPWRGGGLGGPIKIATGLQEMEAEHTYGAAIPAITRRFGETRVNGVGLRFALAYENQATGTYDDVQITLRGRHEEIDQGSDELGSPKDWKVKTACTYYRETINGVVELEIDFLARIFLVGGVDRWAELRRITR